MSKPQAVVSQYQRSTQGRALSDFAQGVARRLDVPHTFLVAERTPAERMLLRGLDIEGTGRHLGPDNTVHWDDLQDVLLVTDKRTPVLLDIPVLHTCGEAALNARRRHKVLAPFGDGFSAVWAFEQALDQLRPLLATTIFYHTTWGDPDRPDASGYELISEDAKRVFEEIKRRKLGRRVPFNWHDYLIETAATVEGGILDAADRIECHLIVMTRGKDTGKGHYVDQCLPVSQVPILVMPPSEGGE